MRWRGHGNTGIGSGVWTTRVGFSIGSLSPPRDSIGVGNGASFFPLRYLLLVFQRLSRVLIVRLHV